MAYRLMGDWRPTAGEFMQLVQSETAGGSPARPYPFCLATPLDRDLASLGEPSEWLCERMWDGIRAQLVRRSGETFLWSTGQELIGAVFPEVVAAGRTLPDGTVLDGALIAWPAEGPMPSTEPQRRLVRRAPGATPRRGVPVVFLAYDLLEVAGQDSRQWPLTKRREALETVINGAVAEKARSGERPTQGGCAQRELFGDLTPAPAMSTLLRLSPAQAVGVWGELKQGQARGRGSGPEGWLLRRLDAPYGAGQQHDDWWTWKLGPLTCHAVLVAAQPGQGRNASLFVDYTFSVWQGRELVSVARSELGLSDAENEAIDAFVRTHTTGRFGPVRWVVPELVFELAFDGLAGSRRHKAGFSLLCPRIVRWRRDKRPEEADAVETLRALAQGERV
jgi:DNA ligase-1